MSTMRMRLLVSLALAASILMADIATGAGVVRRVPSQYPTIQAAVNASSHNDTIIIADGFYSGPGNRDITSNKYITIRSENGPSSTFISCDGTLVDQHFGILLDLGGVVEGLTIFGAYSDKAALSTGGAGIVSNCFIFSNTCLSPVFVGSSSVVRDCLIIDNDSELGGGVTLGAAGEVVNCVITGNTSNGLASAISISGQGAHRSLVLNCTIADNYSDSVGGGAIFYGSSLFVGNTILWGNTSAPGVFGDLQITHLPFASEDDRAEVYNSVVQYGDSGVGSLLVSRVVLDDTVITSDPCFVGDTYRVSRESPCIDSGDVAYSRTAMLAYDLQLSGKPRVVGHNIDMGAYEHQDPPDAASDPDPDPDPDVSGVYFPLTSIKLAGKPGKQKVTLKGTYSPVDLGNEVVVWVGDYEAVLSPHVKKKGVFLGDGFTAKFNAKKGTFTIAGKKLTLDSESGPWDFAVFTTE